MAANPANLSSLSDDDFFGAVVGRITIFLHDLEDINRDMDMINYRFTVHGRPAPPDIVHLYFQIPHLQTRYAHIVEAINNRDAPRTDVVEQVLPLFEVREQELRNILPRVQQVSAYARELADRMEEAKQEAVMAEASKRSDKKDDNDEGGASGAGQAVSS